MECFSQTLGKELRTSGREVAILSCPPGGVPRGACFNLLRSFALSIGSVLFSSMTLC